MSYPLPARHENSGGHIAAAWIFAVLSGFYFLPWAIAATRHKENTLTIFLINFLLGWTGVGWIIALVMSVVADRSPAGAPQQYYATRPAPPQPRYQPPPELSQTPAQPPAPHLYQQAPADADTMFPPLPAANQLPGTPWSYADNFTSQQRAAANPLEFDALYEEPLPRDHDDLGMKPNSSNASPTDERDRP